jgi:UV DNA damage endonuclease
VSAHRIGFAVKVLGEGGLPSHDARRWQSGPHLRVSLGNLGAILDYLDRHDLRMYRMATALSPYASHPDLPQFHHQIAECASELETVGARAHELDVRLSTHPGQYTVLNSERPDVVDAAIAELEVQGELFEALGLGPEATVVIHVGGTAGGLDAAADRFVAGYERLSDRARRYLKLENDDRSFGLGAVNEISARCGVPIVWDVLHHRCHDPEGFDDSEAMTLAFASWPEGVTPKIHYSSPRLDIGERRRKVGRRVQREPVMPQLRAHADLIEPIGFEYFLRESAPLGDFDLMLEAKAKDLAALRLIEQMRARGFEVADGRIRVGARPPRRRRFDGDAKGT